MKRITWLLLCPIGLLAHPLEVRPTRFSFEPDASGRRFTAWNLTHHLAVSARGYEIRLPGARVQATIAGARAAAPADPGGAMPVDVRYIRANGSRHVRTAYAKVRYAEVLPGIDVVYYGRDGAFEFDFVVKPGADPKSIRLDYRGQDRLDVDGGGNLVLHAGGERVVQQVPAVYQEVDGTLRSVTGSYALARNGQVRFRLGEYDRKRPLVIDPVVSYLALPGGRGADTGLAVAAAGGFLYVAGTTTSNDFAVSETPFQKEYGGDTDVFVMKIDPNANTVVYSTFLGGSGKDELKGMAFGADNLVCLVGVTASSNFPTTVGPSLKGTTDGFVAKIDPAAEGEAGLVYSTYIGGSETDGAWAVALDAQGNAFVTGATRSNDFPMAGTTLPESNGHGGDAWVARFDIWGGLTLSSYLGGEVNEAGRAIAVEENGGVIVAGITNSDFFPMPEADSFQRWHTAHYDVFVARLTVSDAGFGLAWATYLGGSDYDEVKRIALGPNGQVVLTGYTLSPDFPVAGNAVQRGYHGNTDAFVAVLDTYGAGRESLKYSTYLGGGNGEVPYTLAVDAEGKITVGGYTLSIDFPATADAMQGWYQGGGADGFLATLDPASDRLVYSSYLGGPGTDVVYGVHAGEQLCVTGVTSSGRFMDVESTAGNASAFVMMMSREVSGARFSSPSAFRGLKPSAAR